jgi:3-deoxy-D-manno-octulosonate 8-phosphate phosphatase (KDO 8-P phosphatase)
VSDDLTERLRRVDLLLLDVDGVLTDGRLGYGPGGDERREFHVRDGLGIKAAQRAGLVVGIITGRETRATALRAEELRLDELHQGRREKLPVWEEILGRRGIPAERACYMGDDLLDLPLLRRAGLAAAPADAAPEVLAETHWRSSLRGGEGCVRELVEALLRARGAWPPPSP